MAKAGKVNQKREKVESTTNMTGEKQDRMRELRSHGTTDTIKAMTADLTTTCQGVTRVKTVTEIRDRETAETVIVITGDTKI